MHEIIVPGSLGDFDGVAWFNGKLIPWRDVKLHAMAHGLHYASGLFDGVRVYRGRAFQLGKHIERFRHGAKSLLMDLAFGQEELEAAARSVVESHAIVTGYIRPIAWRGPGPVFFDPTPNPPNVAIFAWPLGEFIPQGAKLVLSEWNRPSPNVGPWAIKATGNYLPATLQNYRAKHTGFSDALFLDWQGNVADVTGANIFLCMDGVLHTPEPDGFFAGITRQTVIDLAKAAGEHVVVRKIPPADLHKAQEVFLTGSAAGIVAVGSIDLGDGSRVAYEPNGPTTTRLQKEYMDLTRA